MRVNPVFINELRQSALRRRTALIIGSFVLLAVILTLIAQIGSLRNVVVYAPLIILPLIVPAIASGAFAKEYEQHTWMDLYLTRLTNAEVVWGKFGAYFVQTAAAILALAPPLILMLLADYSRLLSDLRYDVVPFQAEIAAVTTTFSFLFKLLISACLYISLTMVCSRYSRNRRASLTWSYIAVALYAGLGWFLWGQVGALDSQLRGADTESTNSVSTRFVPIELTVPGFMESFHLIFCAVVGIGSFFLLWISLGEQRGYRKSDGEGVTRVWQPMAREVKRPVT